MSEAGGRGLESLDPYSSGRTIEDYIEMAEEDDEDPADFIYYTTYSDVYHTDPGCRFIQDTDRLWRVSSLIELSRYPEPYITGPRDIMHDLSECNECKQATGRER